MRKVKAIFSIHWAIIILRWLMLGGITLWLAFGHGFTSDVWPITLLLVLAAVGNTVAIALVGLHRRLALYRFLNVTADVLFTYSLIYYGSPLNINLAWVGLVPLISASLYYHWVGVTLLTILNTLFLLTADIGPLGDVRNLLIKLLPSYLIVGATLTYLSQQINRKPGVPGETEAERISRERRQIIYNLISTLSSTLNYQRVLDMALDLSINTLKELDAPAEQVKCAVLLFTENDNKETALQVAASRHFLPSDARVTVPGVRGLLGRTIDEGQPGLSKDIGDDAELNCFLALHDCSSAYCIPLRSGLDSYGLLLFAHPEAEYFLPDRSEVLDIVGNQATIALQNARLYQDLEQEKERMMQIEDDARKKMARDLHDGPTQSVSAIAMRVNFARRLLERDPKAAAEELFKIEELARRTTKEIRHMLFTLRPLVLESQGLIAALASMAEKMHETYNQNVIIQADQRVVDVLEMGKQAVVFYIAEEAVTNARKHAQAGHIWVRLKLLRNEISLLEIEDDGAGFNVNAVNTAYEGRGSLGMVNMRERTELVNGVLRINSAEGKGTRVQVVIPLTEEAADRIRRGL